VNSKENEISNGLVKYFKTFQKMQKIKIIDLQDITSGWETEIFTFTLQFTENGVEKQEKLVIRIYPGEYAERTSTYELLMYTTLDKQNYPTPKIHYSSTDKQYVGKPFLIMDWITGGVLDKKWETDPEGTMKSFCQLFVDLHNLDWKPINESLVSDKRYKTSIDDRLVLIEQRMTNNNFNELMPIVKWLRKERKRIKEEHLAFCHFDFHTFNILLDENGNPYVIDWPSAHIIDFRFDLAWTLILYRVYTNQDNRNALFQTYQKIAGKQINNIDFFEVAGIARRLTDVLMPFKSDSGSANFNDRAAQDIKDTIFHVENLNIYLEELAGFRIKKIDELVMKIKNE